LQCSGGPDCPLDPVDLVRLAGPSRQREVRLQPVQQVTPVQVISHEVVPPHDRGGGTGGGKLPARLIAHADLRTLQESAHAACRQTIQSNQRDRPRTGSQPFDNLLRNGDRLFFQRDRLHDRQE
jgi:hypothetical protein